MKKPTISTTVIIICILIIGLYAIGEVNYFSSKIAVEKNIDSPTILIPKIGVNEKINNVSLNQGVLSDPGANIPTQDYVTLYGHRTLQGSPFFRLNEIEAGDLLVLEWPGVGEINYTVTNKTIVPGTSDAPVDGNESLFLITCDPIGSTENRIIVEGTFDSQGPIDNVVLKENPQESYGLIIAAAFLLIGLVFSYFYPQDNRMYVLGAVVIIAVVLFYFCINPIPSELIYEKIIFLNGGL